MYKKTIPDSNLNNNQSDLLKDQDSKGLILKPPAQWLQPFQFKLNENSNSNDYEDESNHGIDDYQFENLYLPNTSDYFNSTEYEVNSDDDNYVNSDNKYKISYIISNSSNSYQVVEATNEPDNYINSDNYVTNFQIETTSFNDLSTNDKITDEIIPYISTTAIINTSTITTTASTSTTTATISTTTVSTSTTTTSTTTTTTTTTTTSTSTIASTTKTSIITSTRLKTSFIRPKSNLLSKTTHKPSIITTVSINNLISTKLYNNSMERNLIRLNESFKTRLNNSSKLNINDYFTCQRNLTKLTMFYTNSDKLICYQLAFNTTLYKCNDDILEKKLVMKLGQYYLIQLKPLIVIKSKISCANSSSFFTNESKPLSKPSSIYYDEKQSLICNFITKKATNRKKLVWKLYLILKNQTCIPYLTHLNKENNFNKTEYLNDNINYNKHNKSVLQNYIYSSSSMSPVNVDDFFNSDDDDSIFNQDPNSDSKFNLQIFIVKHKL